jgi:hypothetical protein
MRTITLPHFYWHRSRRPTPPTTRSVRETITPEVALQETKPRAPALTEERFWAVGKVRVFGVPMPNRYQTAFFAALCLTLALPVFLFDKSGHGLYHGFVTLASLAAFAAFCWLIGMILANVSDDVPKDRSFQARRE